MEPPAHVWEGIARRVGPASAPASLQESRRNRLWDSLGFWRGAAALATAAAAALALYVALQPPGPAPAQIAALDQRLTGIETRLAAVDATPREIGALEQRLARIEGATQGLAGTPREIAALGDRLAGLASRLNAVAPVPTHVGVLLDKDQRPMMTADLDLANGRLVLRLNLTPPRDFTAKILEVWMVPPGGTPRSLGLIPQREERHGDVFGPFARNRRSPGQREARGQPRALRRLDDGATVGAGPVLEGSSCNDPPDARPLAFQDMGDVRRRSAGTVPVDRGHTPKDRNSEPVRRA